MPDMGLMTEAGGAGGTFRTEIAKARMAAWIVGRQAFCRQFQQRVTWSLETSADPGLPKRWQPGTGTLRSRAEQGSTREAKRW